MNILSSILLAVSLSWAVAQPIYARETITFATGFESGTSLYRRFQLLYTDAFKRLGLDFKLISLPKDQALFSANMGRVDGDTSRILELEGHAEYTQLLRIDVITSRSHQVAFATNRRLKVHNWEDIKAQNLSVAYPRGHIYSILRVKQLPAAKVHIVENCEQSMKLLQSGRVDLYIDNLDNCAELRRSTGFRSVQVAAILDENLSYPYIHKKHQKLIPKLTEALKASLADPVIHAQLTQLEQESIKAGGAITEVQLYTPYDFEPFVVNRAAHKGLIYDFQRHLNALGDGVYYFNVQTVPRIPSERLRKTPGIAIVPFVAPIWFNDEASQQFDWTLPLHEDQNVIVSSKSKPMDSLDPDRIKGKTICGSTGLMRDSAMQKLIDDEVIKQTLTQNTHQCLLMVAHQRADFYVSGRMLVDYFLQEPDLAQQLHISPTPIHHFARRILISPKGMDLLNWLNNRIEGMNKSKVWQSVMKSYSIRG
jgi:ABC-type amino acid transport substrate-binding protein